MKQQLCSSDIQTRITDAGIVAVLVFESTDEVRPTIDALLAGGINAIELTLRTEAALDAVRIVTSEYPQILCGVGTILTPEQVIRAKDAGADFGVAPGLNRRVMDTAMEIGFDFAPGITTASDIESALEYGCRMLKFFPAEKIGGLSYLSSMNAPYKHLGLTYIPLGGMNQDNLASYAQSEIIAAIGGSWLANRALIEKKAWKEIEQRAAAAITLMNEKRRR